MIIFDEKEYALKLLQDGYIRKNKKLKDIFILAKYFKYKGLSRLQACKEVIKFINKFDDSIYSYIKYQLKKYAIKTVKNAYTKNYTLRFDVKIELSEHELMSLLKLKTIGEKQVMFVLFVLNKFYNSNIKNFYTNYKDIFQFTKLDYQSNNIKNIFNKLIKKKYISIIDKRKQAIITKLSHISIYKRIYFKVNIKPCNNIIYKIDNFDNLMSDFAKCMKLISGDTYCVQCGIPIKQTSNRRKYCSSCWKDVRTQQNRAKFKRWYNKQKSNQLENPANPHE
jgi:hypothetical protein